MKKIRNIQDIVDDVHQKLLDNWPEEEKTAFFLTCWNGNKLIQYHDTLGRWIRNEYRLWSIPWTPDIRDGVDYSPFHPDSVSRIIIEEVWKKGLTAPRPEE